MIRQTSASNFLKFSPMISGGGSTNFTSLFTLLLSVFLLTCGVKSVPCPSSKVFVYSYFKRKKNVNDRKA